VADVYVVNASPIILLLLGKIERLDILASLGSIKLLVPSAVVQEIDAGAGGAAILGDLHKLDLLEIVPEVTVPDEIAQWDLGAGESQVLSVAIKTPGSEVVIDDLAARKCAKTLSCPMIGTVGALLVGKQRGYVQAVKPILTQLLESGLRLSDSMVAFVLDNAGEL